MVLYDDPLPSAPQGYNNSEAVRRLPFPDNLAAAVLLCAVADLRGGNKKRREDARLALRSGGLHWWLEHMTLSTPAVQRVRLLLDELDR